jgi:hypothetical protein
LGTKVFLFWTDRHFPCGRFPPLDRIDYLDYAVPLTEWERVRPARPKLEEIRGAPFAGWKERARGFAGAETLAPKDRKAYLRAPLYPGRFCYSWLTGRMGSNDRIVAHLRKKPPGASRAAGTDRRLRRTACRLRIVEPARFSHTRCP